MPSYSVSRLTLFSVISAIEHDLRTLVSDSIGPQMAIDAIFAGDADLYQRVLKRHREDPDALSDTPTLSDLLNYSDFSDCCQLLHRHRDRLTSTIQTQLPTLQDAINSLAPIRNRVMHTRPLHFDDLARTIDTATDLVRRQKLMWPMLEGTLKRLQEEPSFVLSLDLPSPWEVEVVSHNLPIPDFDETGFIGRDEQLKRLKSLCSGAYPVITIVGEGGVGKTALALRVAYEMLDASPTLFDAVVWTTAKTTMLTPKQIVEIEGAICDSLGMLRVATGTLTGTLETEEPLSELLQYLSTFRILLVLDNLETVLDERLRTFLAQLPPGSKILITSRIGIGAFEYPLKLEPLSNSEAVQLLRALTKSRGLSRLLTVSNQTVSGYCEQMKNNPGYIKWFVSAVQAGARPEEVLADPTLFLDFCMSNVYNFLSEDSRRILQTLQYLSGSRSQAELAFLSDLDSVRLQRGLQQLITTNMVNMLPLAKGTSFQSTYDLSELAREYLGRRHPIPVDIARELKGKRRELTRATGEIVAGYKTNPYSFRTIQVRSPSDHIVAKYLSDAISAVNRSDYSAAETLILEAKRLAPEFYEVHRVEAFLRIAEDNFTAANTCYEAAIEIEPKSAPLRLAYGGFLMRYLDDPERAAEQLKIAGDLDSNAVEIQSERAFVALDLGSFDEAEAFVRKLLARVISSERTEKKIFDLMLQLYQRRAEHQAAIGDYMQAIDKLDGLRNAFEGIPKPMVDGKMLQKLVRARGVARICARNVSDKGHQIRARELEAWFADTVKQPQVSTVETADLRGQIITWFPDRAFGFITGEDDKKYFFHFSAVISQHDPTDVCVGARVVFNSTKDLRGDRAANVEIVQLMNQ